MVHEQLPEPVDNHCDILPAAVAVAAMAETAVVVGILDFGSAAELSSS